MRLALRPAAEAGRVIITAVLTFRPKQLARDPAECLSRGIRMLHLIKPGNPKVQEETAVDASMLPLLAAAAAGEPLEPAMQSIARGFGFENFVYAISTIPR